MKDKEHYESGNMVKDMMRDKAQPIAGEFIPYQCCPKCNGNGYVQNFQMQSTSSVLTNMCDICGGAKIIPMFKHHPATDWDALLSRMQNKFGRSDEYEQVFDFIKNELTK